MDAPVVPWPADRPSGAQEVDEEQGHEPKEDGDGDIDHPVIGAGLGRRGDTRRGRSIGSGARGADVVALVDAQPLLCRVDDSDQLVPVEQLGGLFGAVLVGVLARLEARPGEERGVGTKLPACSYVHESHPFASMLPTIGKPPPERPPYTEP